MPVTAIPISLPLWQQRTGVTAGQLASFSERWGISEFSIFGSVLTEEFCDESDFDILVTFDPSTNWDLYHLIDMRDELQHMFGRPVDLVEKKTIRNPFRRNHILTHHQVIYAA